MAPAWSIPQCDYATVFVNGDFGAPAAYKHPKIVSFLKRHSPDLVVLVGAAYHASTDGPHKIPNEAQIIQTHLPDVSSGGLELPDYPFLAMRTVTDAQKNKHKPSWLVAKMEREGEPFCFDIGSGRVALVDASSGVPISEIKHNKSVEEIVKFVKAVGIVDDKPMPPALATGVWRSDKALQKELIDAFQAEALSVSIVSHDEEAIEMGRSVIQILESSPLKIALAKIQSIAVLEGGRGSAQGTLFVRA